MGSMYVLVVLIVLQMIHPPPEIANLTSFNNQEDLYYKYLGNAKTLNSDWQLINFLDFDKYTTKYLTITKFYNITSQLYSELRQKSENTDNIQSCQQFAQATLPYLYEIDIRISYRQ